MILSALQPPALFPLLFANDWPCPKSFRLDLSTALYHVVVHYENKLRNPKSLTDAPIWAAMATRLCIKVEGQMTWFLRLINFTNYHEIPVAEHLVTVEMSHLTTMIF